MTPRRVQGAVDRVRLRCVAAGCNYTLVASQEGELFSFGNGKDGCLGHGNQDSFVLPERVQALSPARGQAVKEVAARDGCGMALTTRGGVFTWGGKAPSDWLPREVNAPHGVRMTHISVGYHHCAAVSEAGELFTWGGDDDSDNVRIVASSNTIASWATATADVAQSSPGWSRLPGSKS
jgi:alpha-tubulin suppressor-like RCC1 family protein